MPIDAATLITGDNYDPVVNVPATGETITQAALVNEAVALGNRIEYIRRRTLDVAPFPERVYRREEDFSNVVIDSTNQILYADKIWPYTITGPASISFSSGAAKNPGTLDLLMSGASTQDLKFDPMGTANLLSYATLEQMTVVVKLADGAANTNSQLYVGLQDGSSPFDHTWVQYHAGLDKTHWVFDRSSTVPSSHTTQQLGPLVSGTYADITVLRTATGDLQVLFNGALITTVAAADISNSSCRPIIQMHHASSDAQVFSCSIDYFYVRASIADRSGP